MDLTLQPKIYLDIETGGLSDMDDILQVAAVSEFEQIEMYLRPTKPISPGASKVNNLYLTQSREGYNMVRRVKRNRKWQFEDLETADPVEGLQFFFDWCQVQYQEALGISTPKLVAYNGFSFDFHKLRVKAELFDLDTHGLLEKSNTEDTMHVLKKKFTMERYRLTDAVRHFKLALPKANFHDALFDAKALRAVDQEVQRRLLKNAPATAPVSSAKACPGGMGSQWPPLSVRPPYQK